MGRDLLSTLDLVGPAPVVTSELAVDAGGDQRAVVLGKCEEAGELELSHLARTAELEEAFVFVPALCAWIDVGVRQTSSSVSIERKLIDDLAAAFGRVVVYHTHPNAEDATYFPAYADLIGVIVINGRYLEDSGVQIIHRAMTPAGSVEYSFRPSEAAKRAIEAIFSTGLGAFAGENLSLSYTGAAREGEYHDAVRTCASLAPDAAEQLRSCFPMQAGDFFLEYRERRQEAELGAVTADGQ